MDKIRIGDKVFLLTGSVEMEAIGGSGASDNLDPVLCQWMDSQGKKVSRNYPAAELTLNDIRSPRPGKWQPDHQETIVKPELPHP